jgi:hypothetical protein
MRLPKVHGTIKRRLEVEQARSTYFANPSVFPPGSIAFDCGLVMRNIPHEWETAKEMYI